jgi:hypothetical protein
MSELAPGNEGNHRSSAVGVGLSRELLGDNFRLASSVLL